MKIMFVCTGNICRSAMAHAFLEEKTKNMAVEVYSCGTSAENGETVPYNTIEVMQEYGIDISKHRATNIYSSNIEEMDIILCATTRHKEFIISQYLKLINKVYTMKEYVGMDRNGKELDVNDPWGYNSFVYGKCATEIEKITDLIVDKLKK